MCVYTHLYIQLIHFAVHQKLMQHCKSAIVLQINLNKIDSFITSHSYMVIAAMKLKDTYSLEG